MSENIYYVYGLLDPDTGLPFYIGKGKGNRAYSHLKLSNDDFYNPRKRERIESLLKENKKIDVFFYETELSSREASDEEVRLIRRYGRKDFDPSGILMNLTRGGEGGDTSMFFTNESRKKISLSSAGTNNPRSKLTENQVREIYFSTLKITELSDLYQVSAAQVRGIKRKKYYRILLDQISEPPGHNHQGPVLLNDQQICEIYLEENSYDYFKEKYGVTWRAVKGIKTKKSYKKVTENLGAAGHVKKYKLSNQDANDIFESPLSLPELAKKYQVHLETIRNIKKGITRKFYRDPY
jgi:hypothetical protein